MKCREGCAACCIAPSIKQGYANAPSGKKAGEYCINLDRQTLRCRIWGQADYPPWCKAFIPEEAFCGSNRDEAMSIIRLLEDSSAE
ncbi:hypothetical protein [Agaribacterium haliotis]|uniref:hypothetical protein n=1 Tax=Agaribacterium haliotis TaxID=2013869 RepID=UPI000BB54CE2|nr:hypothetical protein [Agaribacterium haliotis]